MVHGPPPSSITTSSRTCLDMSSSEPATARFEQLLRILRHRGVGIGIRQIEVGAHAHDAVEVVPELHVAAEHAIVHRAVGGCIVGEAHAPRPPLRTEQRAQHPEGDADRELRRLPHGARATDDQLLAQHDDLPGFLDREQQRIVEPPPITRERLDCEPQRRLLANQQPERAEMGKASRLGHEQAERFDSASIRRRLQQAAHGVDRDLDFRVFEAALREIELAQQAPRVQPGAAGDVGVVGEAPAANQAGHAAPNGRVPKR